MTMKAIFLIPIIQFSMLLAFTKFVDKSIQLPYSMSNSWYALQKVKRNHIFVAFLIGITLSLVAVVSWVPMNDITELLFVIGFVSVFCIGIAAEFRKGWRENFYHILFSVGAFVIILSSFWIGEGFPWPLIFYLAVTIPKAIVKDMQNRTWWNESDGIACMIIGVLHLCLKA